MKSKLNKNKTFLVLIVVIAVFIISCKPAQKEKEEKSPNGFKTISAEEGMYYKILKAAMAQKNPSLCLELENSTEKLRCSQIMALYIIPETNQTCDAECMNKKSKEQSSAKDANFCSNINDSAMKKGCEDFVLREINNTQNFK